MSHRISSLVVALAALSLAACAGDRVVDAPLAPHAPSHDAAVKFRDANAAANWNEITTSLAARRAVNANRLYAYLSLAQYRAAEDAEAIRPHPPTAAAIAAASADVLKSYFPLDAAEIDADLAAQESAEPWPGAKHQDFETGAALGHAAAARVLAYSAGDLVGVADPGHPPIGPGYWVWNGGPIARGNYMARTIFLSSRDEFRPGPPPAFGSPEYLAALAEIRHLSDTRTPEQLAIAQYWQVNQSPTSEKTMNDAAVELIRSYRVSDVEASRILFLMNATMFDALTGCFDAKYHYWFIRPPMADPAITLPVGLPPHPSYPSAHSCAAGAATGVLALAFPAERERMDSIVVEAGYARMYAGIHYRFDVEAGRALGHAVAQKAWRMNLDEVAVR